MIIDGIDIGLEKPRTVYYLVNNLLPDNVELIEADTLEEAKAIVSESLINTGGQILFEVTYEMKDLKKHTVDTNYHIHVNEEDESGLEMEFDDEDDDPEAYYPDY